jgi:hypothetical protein
MATGTVLSGQVNVGIRIGPPPAPRAYYRQPPRPGPDFVWVDGYWYPVGHRYVWHEGYWTRIPYQGARWIGPRYEGGMFYNGYWETGRGRFDHDHRWDRERDRDRDRWRDRDDRRDRDDDRRRDRDYR